MEETKNAAAPLNEELDESIQPLKLDYKLETPEARNELVKKIIEQTPSEKLTPRYLEILSDYIVFAMDKEERKQKKIITQNRMVTVNKREMSFEGLIATFENGEDGIYNMIANDKNIIFTPKIEITETDVAEIPGLKELRDSIAEIEKQCDLATGKKKYLLKKQMIEMRKDQYVLKAAYHPTMPYSNGIKSFSTMSWEEDIKIKEDGTLQVRGFSFLNPDVVSAVLCHYSKLKMDSWDKVNSDAKWAIIDLENLIDQTLEEEYPMYYDLVIYKIDGKTNEEIQSLLQRDFGVRHSIEYLSSLWRKKIPKMIADRAQKDYLTWYYTNVEKGKWKRCSRCGQIKLAHSMFFSKNNTSKDGFYSICKECRNAKNRHKQIRIRPAHY